MIGGFGLAGMPAALIDAVPVHRAKRVVVMMERPINSGASTIMPRRTYPLTALA
jgi:acyl CoA:acetate/3-ketoacid CoA transferase beta subunit